ncbi:MAG: restriction endonuclease subunit S [Bacillota bacterium]|nr:restriction endonuclease subunit S [Bacillota bacterium]
MEVKPGYKQTEVGVIPQDWAVRTLQQLTDCLDNLRVPLNESQRLKRQGDIPYCGANGVLDYIDEFVIDDDIILIAEDGGYFDEYPTRPIAYRMRGKCWVNNHAHILRAKCGVDQGFVYYSLVHKNILRFLASGTRAKLNRSELNKIETPLPPTKAEQEAIAEALGDADALIESLEQLIAKKRHLKQGAMQELLTGEKRLPGFEVKPGCKQIDVGVIPEDWEVDRLGGLLASAPTYGINAPAIPYDSRYPTYLRITDISEDGRFIDESKASVKHPFATSYMLSEGDLVFARTGASVGKSYQYDGRDGELAFAGFLIQVRPDAKKLMPAYLKYFAQSSLYWNWVRVNSMRSGQPGINGREYASLPIPFPPTKAEQEAITTILSDMDTEIAALEAKMAKARQVKQGMMQELLTGKTRLV